VYFFPDKYKYVHVLAEEFNSCSDNENNAAIEAEIVLETDDEYCQWEVRTSCHWQHFFNKYQRRRRRIIKTNYYGK
jgi:hypothetical protein